MIRRRWCAVFGLAILLLPGLYSPVSAHVLQSSNGISAVLHIIPFDAPVSAEPTRIEFEFSATGRRFDITQYDVELEVQRNNATVSKHLVDAAYPGTVTVGRTIVTFPSAAVYELTVTGRPKQADTLPPFRIGYPVRVTGGSSTQQTNGSRSFIVACFSASILLVFGMIAVSQITSRKRYSKVKEK